MSNKDKNKTFWRYKKEPDQGARPPIGGSDSVDAERWRSTKEYQADERPGFQEPPAAPLGSTIIARPEGPEGADVALFEDDVDPIVGWLVIVGGPGRGRAIPLGAGANSVGRAGSERAALPFGDDQISSENHAVIVYDDRARKFYVQHASGKNLTWLNGEVVVNLTPLSDGDTLEFGRNTRCRFAAFCGAGFDWNDIAADGK
ncbi:FHA domain-containing protein [uncultured Albimonas sp.]|uniref:FHA domain-containing protein n=1 Tax=uncultured Albimonas sp. TaxID=1331701 RepID=UPI0030ECA8C5|tara:strand:- start:7135 stop:7740 length:606 start_codon:yes stop_codon:yes gene_type:complete